MGSYVVMIVVLKINSLQCCVAIITYPIDGDVHFAVIAEDDVFAVIKNRVRLNLLRRTESLVDLSGNLHACKSIYTMSIKL